MAHPAQKQFFFSVKEKHPQHFDKIKVIDCGSLDVNGSTRELFTNSEYLGVDIAAGKNVDRVSQIKDLEYKEEFDTVISGEMLEHDETWEQSLKKMFDMCKKGGLIVITAAGKDRPEHGTTKTGTQWGTSPDYYMNIEEEHLNKALPKKLFKEYNVEYNAVDKDIYFYAIKK